MSVATEPAASEPTAVELEPPRAPAPIEAWVIEDARRRRRRRWARTMAAALAFALAAFVALRGGHASSGGAHRSHAALSPILTLDPNSQLSRAPYMGVACGVANWIGCDRIGLSVWLRHPALAVTATIGGRTFALHSSAWSGPEHHGTRTDFSGFLHPAGITSRLGVIAERGDHWSGAGTPSPLVILTVVRPDQRAAQIWTYVDLMAGWG